MATLLVLFFESAHGRRALHALLALVAIHLVGTIGYLGLGPPGTRAFDAFFMTFITVSTIGYEEAVPLQGNPAAQLFTVLLAFAGIGSMSFILSSMTAFMLETDLNRAYRRKRMESEISQLSGHYIVCGAGRVGGYVVEELIAGGQPFVVIEADERAAARIGELAGNLLVLEGDATQDDALRRAGLPSAAGVFAMTGDDAHNLVISLSAKQMNPKVRVVARVQERRNEAKMLRAGADAIVSPDFSGGLRAAALMVRPKVATLLDRILRTETGLQVQEFEVREGSAVRSVGEIGHSHDWFVVALRRGDSWRFNPDAGEPIIAGETVIALTNARGARSLFDLLSSGA